MNKVRKIMFILASGLLVATASGFAQDIKAGMKARLKALTTPIIPRLTLLRS